MYFHKDGYARHKAKAHEPVAFIGHNTTQKVPSHRVTRVCQSASHRLITLVRVLVSRPFSPNKTSIIKVARSHPDHPAKVSTFLISFQ